MQRVKKDARDDIIELVDNPQNPESKPPKDGLTSSDHSYINTCYSLIEPQNSEAN